MSQKCRKTRKTLPWNLLYCMYLILLLAICFNSFVDFRMQRKGCFCYNTLGCPLSHECLHVLFSFGCSNSPMTSAEEHVRNVLRNITTEQTPQGVVWYVSNATGTALKPTDPWARPVSYQGRNGLPRPDVDWPDARIMPATLRGSIQLNFNRLFNRIFDRVLTPDTRGSIQLNFNRRKEFWYYWRSIQ